MRKLFLMLSWFGYFLCGQLWAQNPINLPAMSNVLPPAPNAYELTKYVGIPITLSTGAVTQNIPLGQITQGKLSVPISLSYNGGNGVKVDQMASRTGVNWVLNAGGVVSRTVMNKRDETSTWRSYPTGTTSSDVLYNYLDEVSRGDPTYDSEPDLFNFNFNGYSGQFILDPSNRHNKVIHLAASPLKVETNFNNQFSANWTIRITIPDGVQYYFGGSNATEETKSIPYGGGCGKNYDTYIPTAWYLTKVKHYEGDEINLTYEATNFNYYAGVSQTLIRTPQSTLTDTYFPNGTPTTCPAKYEDQTCASHLNSKGVRLLSISSILHGVSVGYQSRPDSEGDYLVYDLTFSQGDPMVLRYNYKYYQFEYTYSNNNSQANGSVPTLHLVNRPFLTKVTGPGTNQHIMRYYNMNGLPARLSFSQDHWGYYNGRYNTYLIPRAEDTQLAQIFPTSAYSREPNGETAYYGLLSSITYPTWGRDSLVYEPNTIWESRAILPARVTTKITKQGTGTSTLQTTSFYINNHHSQSTTFNLSTVYGSGVNDLIHQHTIFKLYSGTTLLREQLVRVGESTSFTLALSTSVYRLEINAYGSAAIGTAEINYQPNGITVTANYNVGGARLAKNISRPIIGLPIEKRIIYASLASQTQSSGRLARTPSNNEYYADLPIFAGDDHKQCIYKAGYSNPLYSLNFFSGTHIIYQDVIEVNSNDWKNGGIAHHYIGGDGLLAAPVMGELIHGTPRDNFGFSPGLETSAKTFKKTGGSAGAYTTAIVSEASTSYKMDTRLEKNTDGYIVRRKWTPGKTYSPKGVTDFKPFDVARYTLGRQWIYVDTITNITYDVNAANPVVATKLTLYADTMHLQPTEVRTSMSDGGVAKIKMKYPAEMVADGVATPYNDMIAQHRIATEIVKSRYVGETLLETATTTYGTFDGGLIEPANLQYSQAGGTPVNFVTFDLYNSNGKLLTQAQSNGSKVSYCYGYTNSMLIAECKNALPNEFYHNNFEEDNGAQLSGAHTGNRYHYLNNFPISWTVPNARAYTLRYWYMEGNWPEGIWKLKEEPFTNQASIPVGNGIDDVCIFPTDAQLTTYAYDIGAGTTSSIDAKGATTYYEYDALQRLSLLKDQKKDIVKCYTYNITGPLIEYFNAQQSQNFTKACPVGIGSTMVYTVQAGTYSSTVSQADADNQALADISANGQNNANANGGCLSGNITLSYVNAVTSSISSMVVKDGLGNALYTFNTSQLNAGITIPKGTYTLDFTITGTDWWNSWIYTGTYSDILTRSPGVTSYTLTGVNLVTETGTIYLDSAL